MRRLPGNKSLLMVLFPFFAVAISSAVSPDQKLLSLIPSGAQVVAGINAPSQPGQPDSFILVTHYNTIDLNDFYALTGVDSSRKIHQIIFVAAADNTGRLNEHGLLASGHFDQAQIFRSAIANGAVVKGYTKIRVLEVQPFARERGELNDVRWLAAIDSTVLLFGTATSVQQELDRHLAGSAADSSLLRKLARMRRDDETWCVLSTSARNAEIRNALAALGPKLAELAMDGDAFQFGIRFGRQVEFEYEITSASSSATRAISDSLTQSLAGPDMGSSLLPGPDITVNGSTVHGVIRLSMTRYNTWLTKISAGSREQHASSR